MIGIKCPASQNVQAEERHSFSTTLEGRRKAQVRQAGRRTWSLQTSDATTPAEHSLLSQFAHGVWGAGPFVFVSADAPVSNMLTPEVSTCGPEAAYGAHVTNVGELYIGNGVYAPRSLLSADPGSPMYFGGVRTPVVAGVRVTGSAWVNGAGARVAVFWYNAAGSFITSNTSTVTASSGTVVRSYVSALPPVGAVSCVVGGLDTVKAAQPAITWTDSAQPWALGEGCAKAVVHGVSRDQVLAAPGNVYSNVSFTVSEVG
ncbi:hypothetical protein D3C74_346950 [compost metagenome]